MRKLLIFLTSESGVINTLSLLVVVASLGMISYLLISSLAPFKGGNLNNLFPKKSSFASVALPSGKLTRYGSNPIVPIGPDAYDKYKTGPRVVLKMGPTDYRMWYEAVFGSNATYTAYATSTDGLTWTKQGPIIYPTENWEGGAGGEISPNTILIENGVYKLWYHSYKQSDNHRRIGYATSTDGLTWTKYPNNPILDVGPPGSFDENQIAEPRVFNLSAMGLGSGYRMYYGGLNAGNSWSYGIATSPDGIKWTKSSSNPIFDPGGDTGEGIIYDNGMWHMWYGISYAQGLAYASSPDGLSWTNGPSNPVLTINPDKTQWDNTFVGDSVSVYKDNNTYRIMYTGIHTAIGPIMAPEAISLATIAVPSGSSVPTPTPTPGSSSTPTPGGCTLTSVSWGQSTATPGQTVSLNVTATGTGCNGLQVASTVINSSGQGVTDPPLMTLSPNSGQTTWLTQSGTFTFNANIMGDSNVVKSANLTVSGATPAPTSTPTPTPRSTPTPTPSAKGLTGNYFSNQNLSGNASLIRIDPTVNFNWGNGSPAPSIPVDNFSIRWTGSVRSTVAGNYSICTTTDDGSRLWVNNVQLINQWINHAAITYCGNINLVANQVYPIKMEYYENTSSAVAKLQWTVPGANNRVIIPTTNLLP